MNETQTKRTHGATNFHKKYF